MKKSYIAPQIVEKALMIRQSLLLNNSGKEGDLDDKNHNPIDPDHETDDSDGWSNKKIWGAH